MDDQIQPPPSNTKEFGPIWIKWLFDFYKYVLRHVNRDFFFDVNQGLVDGYEAVHKFGFSGNVTTTKFHVWNAPTAVDLVWQTVAAQYDVYSSDAADAAAGGGALTIQLECLDADFNTVLETVTLTGTTPVTTTNGPYIRCQRAFIVDVDTYAASNVGNIFIEVTSGGLKTGALQAYVEIGEGQTQKTQYTVPAGKTAYINRVSLTVDTTKTNKVELITRARADDIISPMGATVTKHQWDGLISPLDEELKANHIFPERSDIWVSAQVATGSGAVLEVDYDIILADN